MTNLPVPPGGLPSYINPNSSRGVAKRSMALIPGGSPPRLSIAGGQFCLYDSAGNMRPFDTNYADVVIVELAKHQSKIYFPNNYTPDSSDPPLCFSDNGVGPSRFSAEPQSPTCAACRWGKWGSKISQMGSEVKACADQLKLAVIVPGLPGMTFLLRVPPNSLKDWKAYSGSFSSTSYDVPDIVTRLSFKAGEVGHLQFAPCPNPWLEDPVWAQAQLPQARQQSWDDPNTLVILGWHDEPVQGLTDGPGYEGGRLPQLAQQLPQTTQYPPQTAQQPSQAPASFAPGSPAVPSAPPNPPSYVGGEVSPSVPAQPVPGRRSRRGRPPANGPAPAQQGSQVAPFPHPGAPQQAPTGFQQSAASAGSPISSTVPLWGSPPSQGANSPPSAGQFGMAAGAPADQGMQDMLRQHGFMPPDKS